MKKNHYGLIPGVCKIWKSKFLKRMRIVALLILITVAQTFAVDSYGQSKRLSLNAENETIVSILEEIERQSEFYFMFDASRINVNQRKSVDCENQLIGNILDQLFEDTGITYSINDRQVLLTTIDKSDTEQQKSISGKVTDSSGQPLPGVTVVIKGTTQGTITDVEGKYTIANIPDNAILQFSFVGMKTQEFVTAGESVINVVLEDETIGIEEVVAIGYGTIKKSDLTGSLSSVSSDQFAQQNISRVDQALQGRASGVQVNSTVGAPGGEVRIRIRGANSVLGSNEPLYVIDGFVGGDFNILNPNDIESIEILKDAASTAIYGSRGSNGVILITTKDGKKGQLKISYQGQVSVSNVIKKLDVLNAGDFAVMVNERNNVLGQNPTFTQDEINSYYEYGGVDWQSEIFRSALSNSHQLEVSGGTDKATFFVSANYLDDQGIIKDSGFKRYTLRSNLKTNLNEKLSFRVNIMGSNMRNLNTQINSGMTQPIVQALAWSPTTPIYDKDGNYTLNDPVGSLKPNPLAIIYDQENRVERTFANVLGGIRYEFIKGLTLDIQLDVDYLMSQTKGFSGNYITNFIPSASLANARQVTLQSTNSLSYNRVINEVHTLNAVAVFETQEFKGNYSNVTASGLKFPNLKYDNLGQASSYTVSSDFNKWTLMSFLGRINYTFNDRFLFSASVRRDGSSKFDGKNRFSIFPAFAIGWNLANEDFVKSIGVFSKLKIRGSWGWTGSQAIEPYATLSTYDTNVIIAFNRNNLTSGIRIGNPGNKDLKWETTEQKDIGLEVGLLNGRVNVEMDYYIKNTSDLLLNRPLPGYSGGGVYVSNVGEIENKGWDFSIGGNVIQSKDLNWESNFNISNVQNKVISLGDIADRIFTGSNVSGIATQSEFVYQPGQALGSYYGLKYLGTWKPDERELAAKYGNVPGDARYEDINGDFEIGNEDYQIIGNGIPKTTMGWNNMINYKNIHLNIFFQGTFGSDKLNYTRGAALMGDRDARQPILAEINERYIPGVNETSNLPAFSKTNRTLTQSTMFMESGDFIRLKNLSLSYDLPKSILPNINRVQISLSATNLLTLTF